MNQGSSQESNDSYQEASWMLRVLEEFSGISNRFKIVIAREQISSNDLSDDLSAHIFIGADHDGMVKFESVSDGGYQKMKEQFAAMMKEMLSDTE
ncbi:uncharacterized protein N7482_007521 [Penicillium canariense]|uniref:Uncharacterized protein n=1 Tax=Penicillium canariense TaxID=189055 RepID=A0A9W9LJ81_9EURO|nr:uncharacterized protein N7482_007521 [Penicillium canariense]KAJ5160517.1 hypothetical protein N7482_007521 [Penicillium canariense]